MVSKEKRQLYNKRYYAKKMARNTSELNEPTSELNDSQIVPVDEMKINMNTQPHYIVQLFFRMFHFIRINVFSRVVKWFMPLRRLGGSSYPPR